MNYQESWKRETNFDLTSDLNKIGGPIIEIGGPTESGFPLANWGQIKQKTFISNIEPGAPTFDKDGTFSHYYGKVDFQADAQHLPFQDGSIGAIRADSLPPDVFENAIDEARRVLIQNGLLILQGVDSDDVLFVTQNGFTLVQYKLKDSVPYYCVFKKSE